MTSIYFGGCEDSDFNISGAYSVGTTSGTAFRTGIARCCVFPMANNAGYIANPVAFAASSFWLGARWIPNPGATVAGRILASWTDSGGIVRLTVETVAPLTGPNSNWAVFKIDNVGTRTQLGSNFTCVSNNTQPWKWDFNVILNASGTVNIYFGTANTVGTLVFTYSGDTTTNSVTSAAFLRLYSIGAGDGWSEVIMMDSDTRMATLQTLAPVANGNTHNFDTGTPAAANVNEVTTNDATLDGSSVAGQIDQYTIPAIVAGTYSIVAVGISGRLQKGTSGPTKIDFNVRSGGTDYLSSDVSLTTAFVNGYANWWTTDPNTSAIWAALPTNIGLKSVA